VLETLVGEESGSGKSASSMALLDLLPNPTAPAASRGSIKLNGGEITGVARTKMRTHPRWRSR
jgi:ABC-type glutathione transport system ATPase component